MLKLKIRSMLDGRTNRITDYRKAFPLEIGGNAIIWTRGNFRKSRKPKTNNNHKNL